MAKASKWGIVGLLFVWAAMTSSGNAAIKRLGQGQGNVDARAGVFDTGVDNSDAETAYGISGAWGVPLYQHYALQLEASFVDVEAGDAWALGGKAFRRHRDTLAYGLVGWLGDLDGYSSHRVGLFSEWYLTHYTLAGSLGMTGADFDIPQIGYSLDDQFFADIDLYWYPRAELAVNCGLNTVGEEVAASLGAEWGIPRRILGFDGASVFVDASIGFNGYLQAFIGLRWGSGQDATLMDSHRATPGNRQIRDMAGLYAYAAQEAGDAMEAYLIAEARRAAAEAARRAAEEAARRAAAQQSSSSFNAGNWWMTNVTMPWIMSGSPGLISPVLYGN
jgi:hypothetical protein